MKYAIATVLCFSLSSAFAASQNKQKLNSAAAASPAPATVMTKEIVSPFAAPSATSAIVSTNLADIGKNRMNVTADVMMTSKVAVSLSYSNQSEKEERKKITGKPKLTVDRANFGIGANFFLKPIEARYNLAIAPAMIFQTEKDSVNTDNNNGFGLRAMGIFKPLPRLMAQGGISVTVLGSETKTDALVGMGLLF